MHHWYMIPSYVGKKRKMLDAVYGMPPGRWKPSLYGCMTPCFTCLSNEEARADFRSESALLLTCQFGYSSYKLLGDRLIVLWDKDGWNWLAGLPCITRPTRGWPHGSRAGLGRRHKLWVAGKPFSVSRIIMGHGINKCLQVHGKKQYKRNKMVDIGAIYAASYKPMKNSGA